MALFGRIQDLLEGGGDLFRAEAELAGRRIKHVLVSSAALGLGVLIVMSGVAVAMAGLTILLARNLGWPLALAAVGTALVIIGSGVWMLASLRLKGEPDETILETAHEMEVEDSTPKQDAQEAKQQMKDAVSMDSTTPKQAREGDSLTDELEHLKKSAVEMATKNPVIAGSAALLVVSLFGPGRTVKLVSRGMALAGLAASALEAMTEDESTTKEQTGPATQREMKPDARQHHRRPMPRPLDDRRVMRPPTKG